MTDLAPDYQAALDALVRADAAAADPLALPLAEARRKQKAYFDYLARDLPPIDETRDVSLDGPHGPVPVRLCWPSAQRHTDYTVFVRGAGWWTGDLDSHERSARQFARLTGFPVCSIDYHCAPEARFPVQRDEVVFAVQWLADHAGSLGLGDRFLLQGESAGANLCVLATAELGRLGKARPCALVLFYGNFAGPSENSRPYSRWVWSNYLGSDVLPAESAAVPLAADLSGFPPAWLGVGEEDPLLSDSVQLAERLRGAGVQHTLKRYRGLPHAFVMLSGMSAAAHAAVADGARFAAAALGEGH